MREGMHATTLNTVKGHTLAEAGPVLNQQGELDPGREALWLKFLLPGSLQQLLPFLSPSGKCYYQLGNESFQIFFNTITYTMLLCFVFNLNGIILCMGSAIYLFYSTNILVILPHQCSNIAFPQPELISSFNFFLKYVLGFPGGTVVKNPPANAGDMGSSPGPGRSHMPWSN